jgi:transposase
VAVGWASDPFAEGGEDARGGRLAAHLAQVTGIRFSDDRLRVLLRQEGFSFHRPKHTLKGKRDEAAYEKAEKQLVRLKKKP